MYAKYLENYDDDKEVGVRCDDLQYDNEGGLARCRIKGRSNLNGMAKRRSTQEMNTDS